MQDIDAAVEFHRKASGITAWNVAIDLAKEQTEKEYFGAPGDFQSSCAYGDAGETLIELARHDGARSVHKDWLDVRGSGPHDIGFCQTDADDCARADAHCRSLGLPRAMAGLCPGPLGNCRWACYDTRPFIGGYTELYCVDGEIAARTEHLRRGVAVSITR